MSAAAAAPETGGAQRIATIDGLRGIAVLLVVWYHVWQISWQSAVVPVLGWSLQPVAETGWLGVELFFFISGFVLTVPFVQARLRGTPPPGWRHFFGRRFVKIVPSYALCIAVALAIGYQTYGHAWGGGARRGVPPAVHPQLVRRDARLDQQRDVVARASRSSSTCSSRCWCSRSCGARCSPRVAMAVVANAWRIWALAANHYFLLQRESQLPAYADLFAAGMLCAYAYVALAANAELVERRRWAFSLLMAAGVAVCWMLVLNCFGIAHDQKEWPEPWEVHYRTLLACAIGATALGSLFAVRPLQALLVNPPLLFLAAISYNLYLWHQLIARELLMHRWPPYAGADAHDDRAWQLAFAVVAPLAAIAVAGVVTYGFERPLLRLRRRRPVPHGRLAAAPRRP